MKRKYSAHKEAKRRSREAVGQPPRTKVREDKRRKRDRDWKPRIPNDPEGYD